jgi:hypothetical protein
MIFEYKCVPGPMIVAVRNAKARDQAVKAFEDIMNIEAAQGWEYVGIDEFHISEPAGGLLSRKRVFVPSKILVFRREKKGSPVVQALKTQAIRQEAAAPEIPEPAAEPDARAEAKSAPTLKAITEKLTAAKD